jgi:PepSY-associated TM region
MRALILLHRWLGVVFCFFFAMWFATGIVMHFVPFPALSEAARFAGLPPIELARVAKGPAAAVAASGIAGVTRVRLVQRSDGPLYIVSSSSALKALRAADLGDGAVQSDQLALTIAKEYARRRRLTDTHAAVDGRTRYDQWTVAGRFDPHRPLYRVALNDDAGHELYVSSATGEIVLETTRRQRVWNYVGSVAHWIYPTLLRRHAAVWTVTVWALSFAAMIGAVAGALIGVLRVGAVGKVRLLAPYRGWQAWHHCVGLVCMTFVLSYIFSGWLSMDSGLLFSTGRPTTHETAIVAGAPDWATLSADQLGQLGQTSEVEWFAFDGRIYRRARTGLSNQQLTLAVPRQDESTSQRPYLQPAELNALAPHLASACSAAAIIKPDDDYGMASSLPGAPVFRVPCGAAWFDVDGASGALLEKLDPSARVYRWLYDGLHTLDFPVLTGHPRVRTALVVTLCGCGFLFSLSGVVLALRRVRLVRSRTAAGAPCKKPDASRLTS